MSRPTALYRLFDAAGRLLYIGIAVSPRTRWYAHREEKSWWPEVARETIEWFPSRVQAESAEKAAIKTEAPMYNVTHSLNRKRGDAAAENKSKYARVRTVRIPDPDWSDMRALAGRDLTKVVCEFVAWYLRRPGAKAPSRPAAKG